MTDNTNWSYKHDTPDNCALFQMKVRSKVSLHSDAEVATNMKKLIKKAAVAADKLDAANEALFAIITGLVGCPTLAQTLMQRYDDKGGAAYHYICGSMSVGSDENKLDNTEDEYYAIVAEGFRADITPTEARDKLTKMTTLRTIL